MLPPELGYLWLPLAACLILTGIHCYLGTHVIERQVIFVDLALAQIAALGATVALLTGHALDSNTAYFTSLGFAFVGAAVFAMTRVREERIPQEAIIGIVYAVASAAAIVAVSAAKDPHGAEHIKDLLAGNIILVRRGVVLKTLGIYSLVALFHFVFRAQLIAISFTPEKAYQEGMNVKLWDFLFYLSFAFVITSSVQLAGVLLVFAYLIVPAVIAALLAESLVTRLLVGWGVGAAVSFVGLLLSYELPAGPVLVCLFGAVLAAFGVYRFVAAAEHKVRAAALVAGVVIFGALMLGMLLKAGAPHTHPGHHHSDEPHSTHTRLSKAQVAALSADVEIDEILEKNDSRAAGRLAALWHKTKAEPLRLKIALGLARFGHASGLGHLVSLLRTARTPGTRITALGVLQQIAGSDLGYDMLEPTEAAMGKWESWWRKNRSRVRWHPERRSFELPK